MLEGSGKRIGNSILLSHLVAVVQSLGLNLADPSVHMCKMKTI